MNGMHFGIRPIDVNASPVMYYFNGHGELLYWTGRSFLHSFVKISSMMTGAM